MNSKFDPETIQKAAASPRWSALVRTGVDVNTIGTWDAGLLRESRVLVPIDLQALYVPTGSAEPMVRTPLAISAPDGQDPPAPTPILDPGTPRPAGVHLHWAPPDALLRGSLADNGSSNKLKLPALPDRWVVLRILVPKGAQAPHVRGWVLEADNARAVPLESWPAGAPAIPQTGRTVPAAELTGSVGGSVNWVGTYDAGVNRLSFFDPLDDLATVAPGGTEANQASYLVAGWWSTATLDPLDGAQTSTSLHHRLQSLKWALADDAEGGDRLHIGGTVQRLRQESIGLDASTRYSSTAPKLGVLGRAAATEAHIQDAISTQVVQPVRSIFVDDSRVAVQTEPGWPRSACLHGVVHGVPTSGPPPLDNRPKASDVGVALGEQGDDIAAALASTELGAADEASRRALERLLSAFTGHLLDRVGSADGLVDVEEHEHAASFVARHGGAGVIDRLQSGRQLGAFAAGRQARGDVARTGLGSGGGKRATSAAGPGAKVTSFSKTRSELSVMSVVDQRSTVSEWAGKRPDVEPAVEAREVVRPAPRLYLPAEPILAVRGAKRSLRHGGDGHFSQDGLLHCRWPSQVSTSVTSVIDGADLIPSLQSGAVPTETLLLAREAVILNPYLATWLAAISAKRHGFDPGAAKSRMVAEAALRYGVNAVYDGRSSAFQTQLNAAAPLASREITSQVVADQFRRFSLVAGVDPDPVGVTAWSQPWIPLWIEWEVQLNVSDRLEGWHLGPVDADLTPDEGAPTEQRTFLGRSAITTGTAATLGSAVRDWLVAEDQRDRENKGEADEATEAALSHIADAIEHLDVVAASLDGIREQLLGFVYDHGLVRPRKGDGTLGDPVKSGEDPAFLRAGDITVTRARVVDAFGRTLDLPLDKTAVPVRSSVPDLAATLRLRPRVTVPARVLFRFVDPAPNGADAAEATVDQVDPTRTINPVAGFLLPDHIDEALEVFGVDGAPLGQLMHEPIGGGVAWEIAPGRTGPADAGPLFDLQGAAKHLGFFAAGIVKSDAVARDGAPLADDKESALSALLRAIDTTLWTVDAFRGLGSEHIAGLVGRPLAVVRTRLTIDLQPDLGFTPEEVSAALADRAFTVRLGELTRADDGLVGYFVDDDYEHVHVVDKIIKNLALESGRQRGQLGRYGAQTGVPPTRPIDHPYVIAEDEMALRPGQTVVLTLLMIPSGQVHLTSGVLPRKSLQLARDWVAPGLSVMAPSARIGPVLIDPTQVRLPKISAFPKNQIFTRRDTPLTWKDDPILAATQTALLPDLPHDVQEGYIRISPDQGDDQS